MPWRSCGVAIPCTASPGPPSACTRRSTSSRRATARTGRRSRSSGRCETNSSQPLGLFLGAGGARDFLAPFWRGLARRVEGTPFDRTRPDLHASFAVAQCLDWRGVTRSVVATAGYADEPVLLARLAEAELRCGERVRAIEHLMRLCWLAADAAAEHLDAGSLGDGVLLAAWQSFQDLDPEIAIDAAWFPATLLLDEPGLARVCAPVAPEPPAAPVRAYATLAALFSTVARRRTKRERFSCAGNSRTPTPVSSRFTSTGGKPRGAADATLHEQERLHRRPRLRRNPLLGDVLQAIGLAQLRQLRP